MSLKAALHSGQLPVMKVDPLATACHLKEKRKKNAPRKAVHAYEIDDATESKPKPKSLFDSIPLLKGHTASLQREFSRGLFMVAP